VTLLLNVKEKLVRLAAMTSWSRIRSAILALLGICLWSGCQESPRSEIDEQREPHFMAGKNRVNSMDYKGAIVSFQRALEVNPQSASAHFELGWLFDEKEPDPAAAIYHYGRYLQLMPAAGNGETVRSRILACKQELASTVTLSPVTKTLQDELQRALDQNRGLREQAERWKAYAQQLEVLTNSLTRQRTGTLPEQTTSPSQPGRVDGATSPGTGGARNPGAATAPRTHTVKAGETPTVIARKYGVKLDALLAANPRMDPRRMRVGTVLVLPPSQ
jgi:LysM repeat protein